MSETFTAVKSSPATTPPETYVEVSHTLTEGVLVYRPGDNSFIALYPDEWLMCRADGHQNKTAIEELQDSNRDVTAKSLLLRSCSSNRMLPKRILRRQGRILTPP